MALWMPFLIGLESSRIVKTFGCHILTLSMLTLILLLANLVFAKRCKKPKKILQPWHMGTHLRVLTESYLMSTNMTGF